MGKTIQWKSNTSENQNRLILLCLCDFKLFVHHNLSKPSMIILQNWHTHTHTHTYIYIYIYIYIYREREREREREILFRQRAGIFSLFLNEKYILMYKLLVCLSTYQGRVTPICVSKIGFHYNIIMRSRTQTDSTRWILSIWSLLDPPQQCMSSITGMCRQGEYNSQRKQNKAKQNKTQTQVCLHPNQSFMSSTRRNSSSAPRQNSRLFADNIFICIFVNKTFRILVDISVKFVPKGPNDNIPALVQILAWHHIHWNENVVILTKSSSLAALKVVKMTTFSAASDENFIKMTTFPFQCIRQALIWTNADLIHWRIYAALKEMS